MPASPVEGCHVARDMQRFYPAVIERGTKERFGVWFPDFPRCVAGDTSQEQAMARAQEALAQAVRAAYARVRPEKRAVRKARG